MLEIVRLKNIADSLRQQSDQIYAVIANLEKSSGESLSEAEKWSPKEFARILNDRAGQFLSDRVPLVALVYGPNHYWLREHQDRIAASPNQEFIAEWQALISVTNRRNKFGSTRWLSAVMDLHFSDVGQIRRADYQALCRKVRYQNGIGKGGLAFLRTTLAVRS